jgi:hypothetical protein
MPDEQPIIIQATVKPAPEPAREPFDPHLGPLDNPGDARYLDPADPRRMEIERRRGRPFTDDEEG